MYGTSILFSLILLICCYYKIAIYKNNIFFYEISNIKSNNKKIKSEIKNYPPFNDSDLKLPKLIEYEVKRNIIILFSPKVVLAVLSSPYNFKKRYSFREKSKLFCCERTKCKFIFFIGYSKYENDGLIKKEVDLYNDIVQFSFQNSYLNLTLLSIMAIKYIFRNFKTINFYIKTDDDILINFTLMFNIIKSINYKSNRIYGHFGRSFKVNRNNKSKTYIPYFEYPDDYCPDYVYGGLIIITYAALSQIYNTTSYEQLYVWKEDVNLGIICSKCNVSVFKFPFNVDIITKKKKCKMKNNSIAVEIYSKEDKFYCNSTK